MQYDIDKLIKGFQLENSDRVKDLQAQREQFRAKLVKLQQEGAEDYQSIGEAISHLSDLWNDGHAFTKTELIKVFQKTEEDGRRYVSPRYMGYDEASIDDLHRKIAQHERLIAAAKVDPPVVQLLKMWKEQGVSRVSDHSIEKSGFTGYKLGRIFLRGDSGE